MLAAITLALSLATTASAANYWLDPGGDDAADGSREAPWRTLARACPALEAGDTLTLMPGSYPGTLALSAQGTAEAPIVVRAADRRTARLLADGDGGHAIVLEGAAHVRLEGLWVKPDPASGRYLLATNTDHLTVRDCLFEDAAGGMPVLIDGCEQVRVIDSVIREYVGHNMARVANSSHVLFEGCSISRTGHCPLQFYPDDSTSFCIFRGNVFHAAWGRNFALRRVHHMLFENNIVTNAFNSGRSASSVAKFWPIRGIFRHNRIFDNPGGPLNVVHGAEARFYNNVFDDNAQYGYLLNAKGQNKNDLHDLIFARNTFSRNGRRAGARQVLLAGTGFETVHFRGNAMSAAHATAEALVQYEGQALSAAEADSAIANFQRTLHAAPDYRDPETYDHALTAGSALIDAGEPLTVAVGEGEGTVLPVADALWFHDGYGIDGERGDTIAVGSDRQIATVTAIDYEANTLTLDRPVRWSDGDPVGLPWAGAAPDIGAYEHGASGRPAVQVTVEPYHARPGQTVRITAVMHGALEPERIVWHLGDGALAEGPVVEHAYAQEYDYPIRVRVTAADGTEHVAPGYVRVEEPLAPGEPLLHTTFDADDDEAWWHWKSYRPGPARYRDIVDEETGEGYRRVIAPEDRGRLPCQVHPRGWDIDRYPLIRMRYRVGEGTPIAIALRAFSTPRQGSRMVIVAPTPAAEPPADLLVGDWQLRDDEQWHEVTLDARVIREKYPEVQVLEGMRIGAMPREQVAEGDWYEIDEVVIGPAE
jgi:hypothetical protein